MSTSVKKADIVKECRAFLKKWFQEEMPSAYVYHNFFYAEETVEDVLKVAENAELELSEQALQVLSLAAWFHYTGLSRQRRQYTRASAQIAREFLLDKGIGPEIMQQVEALLHFSEEDRAPQSDLEKIYHDGINLIVGRKSFFKKAELKRLEEEYLREEPYSEKEWSEYLIDWLSNTHFYIAYARQKYGKRKLEHLAKQKQNDLKAEQNTLKRLTGKNVGRGIDTLYRTGFRNHINLSRIADGKANMMISINTIVLSILLAISGAGLSFIENFLYDSPGFALPVLILLLSSLTALVFAVFSAKPSVTEHKLGEAFDPNSTETNMLYFGNFLQLDKEDFVDYLSNLKVDQEQLYNDLSRDLYNLGLVLRKKYRLLTISYNVFVGGLVLSVLVFLGVYLLAV